MQTEEIFSRLQNFLCKNSMAFERGEMWFISGKINQTCDFWEISNDAAEKNLRYF